MGTFLGKQEMCTLEDIAKELRVPISGSKEAVIRNIRVLRKDVLQEHLGMSVEDASSHTKDQMYKILYESIVKAAMEQEEVDGQEMGEIDPKSGQKKSKSK